jgi:hypothetical protein
VSPVRVRAEWRFAFAAAWLAACDKAESPVATRFNSDDRVEVAVTAAPELGAAVVAPLRSTTGAIVIGEATVDPGSGPVGTVHDVFVVVDGPYVDSVGSVDLVADSGARGVETIPMIQDSADHALWWRAVVSVGDVGEERVDTFGFELWRAEGATDPVEPPAETTDSDATTDSDGAGG